MAAKWRVPNRSAVQLGKRGQKPPETNPAKATQGSRSLSVHSARQRQRIEVPIARATKTAVLQHYNS